MDISYTDFLSNRLAIIFNRKKIIEMAEVTRIGLDTFGDMNKFKLWLDTPNFSLGSLKTDGIA